MAGQEMDRILVFIRQLKEGTIRPSARAELDEWINASESNLSLFNELVNEKNPAAHAREDYESLLRIRDNVKARIGEFPIPSMSKEEAPGEVQVYSMRARRWMSAAAIAVLLLSGGLYFGLKLSSKNQAPAASTGENQSYALAPGGNKAVLTLAGGKRIVLDSVHNGKLSSQAETIIEKKEDGKLDYHAMVAVGAAGNEQEILYNTLSTPRGGQYVIKLSDGTNVWLNAASTLRYPVAFAGKERKVELAGEAYFEVAKNSDMPFHVQVKGIDVEVLGTHFNVNSYADEPTVNTTLLEGAVRVRAENEAGLLAPGEQAQANKGGGLKIVKDADTEKAVAWKNGMFQFKSEDIPTIMRQVARWYDVEISYEDNLPTRKFTGKIPRNQNASELLNMLEYIGIHFKIEGKEIKVMH